MNAMLTLQLSPQQIDDVSEALDDPSLSERAKIKLLVIRMHNEGAENRFIAKCLRLSINTPLAYIKEFQAGGIAALVEDRFYRPSSSLEPFWSCLRCSFMAAPVANAKQAMARIEAMTGIRLSESQVRRAMNRLGLVLRKAAPIPGKADPQLQFDFYRTEMLPRLEEASAGKRKVFFVDAAHFVLGAFLGMIWCFARIFIRTSPGRQRYSILGAVDAHSKQLITVRTTGNIQGAAVCELLELIRKRNPGVPVTVVLDNAPYQHSREVRARACALEIELLYLPAYSPNLNLIERLWKLVKKKCLSNRFYNDFQKFKEAIDACLDNLNRKGRREMKTLLSLNFQFFANHKS
jgi:transposase